MAWVGSVGVNDLRLVNASAGSGKTYTLMQVVNELVLNEHEDPSCILATTFTDKAAAELKQRIRKTLLESDAPDASQKAAQAASGLIGTVNGVAGRILTDYAMDAGLAPQLQVLDEDSARTIFRRATASIMDNYEANIGPCSMRLGFKAVKSYGRDRAVDWRNVVLAIVDRARANGISNERLFESRDASIAQAKNWFDGSVSLSLEDIAGRWSACASDLDRSGLTQKGVEYCKKGQDFLKFKTWPLACDLATMKLGKKDLATSLGGFRETLQRDLVKASELQEDVCKMIGLVFEIASKGMEAYRDFEERYGVIDFTDQESRLLELLKDNAFQAKLRERVHRVLVDEFQDTSPIQLALFTKLGALADGKMIWVGDPKQSIYGFRGSDPELMMQASSSVPKNQVMSLKESWRSKEALVKLSNVVFEKAFSDVPGCSENVSLGIPEKRKGKAKGGVIEAWMLRAGKAPERMGQIADGIKHLNTQGVPYGDVAVLLRTGEECNDLAAALTARDIPVAAGGGSLFSTPEVRLAMAAYRFVADSKDTVALAVLAALVMDPEGWLKEFSSDSKACVQEWEDLAKVSEIGDPSVLTPLELLDRVILHFNVDLQARRQGAQARRIGNLEELRARCSAYMSACAQAGRPATHAGFIVQCENDESGEAMIPGGDSVKVLTYHKSKGLEWPTVILGSLDAQGKRTPFELSVITSGAFDPSDPLKGRMLCWVPCPFGGMSSQAKKGLMRSVPAYERADDEVAKSERAEQKRLMYVGLTRAKNRLVFAPEQTISKKGEVKVSAGWLDALTEESLFAENWKASSGKDKWKIGDDKFAVETRVFDEISEVQEEVLSCRVAPVISYESRPAAKVAPSSLEGIETSAKVGECILLSGKLPVAAKGISSELGDCFHGYMAVALCGGDDRAMAEGLVSRWGVAGIVAGEDLVAAGRRLREVIEARWPGCRIETEVPMSYRNELGQVSEGFIDMLVRVGENDYVIIDHKVVHDGDHEALVNKYAGQQEVYRKTIEADGGHVKGVYLHLPHQGELVEIDFGV